MTTRNPAAGLGPQAVTINKLRYILARHPATHLALYSSTTEAYQHINAVKQFANSDKIEVVWDDWSQGLGEGFYTGGLLSTVKGKLYLPPSIGSGVAANAVSGTLGQLSSLTASSIRYGFEEKDANGVWYLYLIAPQTIYKININGATPFIASAYGPKVLSTFTTSPFTSSDFIGQPVKAFDATDNGQRWFLPLNNANRIMVLDTVGTEASTAYTPAQTLNGAIDNAVTAIVVSGTAVSNGDVLIIDSEKMYVRAGGGTSNLTVTRAFAGTTAASHNNAVAVTHTLQETWRVFTTVTDGASHFRMMPDGTVYRAIYDGVGGATATPTQAKVSLLAAGADLEANANWGAEFAVSNPSSRIRGLTNIADLMIILKDDGCFHAIKNPDNTLYFQDMLPDAQFHETATVENQTFIQPTVWHGKVMIPTPTGFWRHNLWQALPVGPDAIAAVTGSEKGASGYEIKYGTLAASIDAGGWIYATYNVSPNVSAYNWYLLVGKERTGAAGEPEKGEIQWYPLISSANDNRAQGIWFQRNGTGAPRVWVGTDGGDIYYFSPAQDGNPFFGMAGTGSGLFGDKSSSYRFFLPPVAFPCLTMLREFQLFVEKGLASCTWTLTSYRDGSAGGDTVGAGLTGTGSLFYTSSGSPNDLCRRVQLLLMAQTSSGYSAQLMGTAPNVVRAILLGHLLPYEGAVIDATIDVKATRVARGVSEKRIRSELKNVARTSAQPWVDPHGYTGFVLVDEVEEQPSPDFPGYSATAGLDGASFIRLKLTLLKYSTTFTD